ncbi:MULTISPECIES: YbbR-like domain-containing protein [unclassified Ruminococcus]|uniref:CdaR family protein n=1 Tax=unclassified Ruminococcus TaxID=2608920 RepID=UPI00210BBA82|nr:MULTISPECIES: CdaR family protein [unclassified Ruminococcus]MCQ4022477.1 hypothetical protein [Ruminococcus sp. zg-924]MCQ4115183.1 hypothetical protein [Ruminococcus sp. zg-921]
MKRSKKITLSKLFRNDKFLIVFAFVSACILWFVFSQNSGEESVTTITDIPINIELSQEAKENGLEVFSKGSDTASVRISGNKITIGTVRAEDILVTASQTGTITSSNTYPLELKAKQNSNKTNYTIESVEPSFVNVYVDKRRSMEFNIKDDVKYDIQVDQTYYAGNPIYSTEKVTVSGPETEVLKVESVAIVGEISGQLKSTAEIEAQVVLYDSFGEEINSEYLTVSTSVVRVSVPILPEKTVPIKATFTNAPSGISLDSIVTVEPSEIIVAGPETTLNTLQYIELPAIDFSKLDPATDGEYELDVNLPSDCRNISNVTKAKVTINLKGYTTQQFTVTGFKFKNVSEGSVAKATTTDIAVMIAGPADALASLTEEDITATVDMTSKGSDFVGSTEIPVEIKVNNNNCWVYGTYTVNVNVEKKTTEN